MPEAVFLEREELVELGTLMTGTQLGNYALRL